MIKTKKIIKKDECIKFYDTSSPIYLDTDASGVSLGVRLLLVIEGMNGWHDEVPDNATLHPFPFTSKSLLSAKLYYSNIEWEPLEYYTAQRSSTITVLLGKYT